MIKVQLSQDSPEYYVKTYNHTEGIEAVKKFYESRGIDIPDEEHIASDISLLDIKGHEIKPAYSGMRE